VDDNYDDYQCLNRLARAKSATSHPALVEAERSAAVNDLVPGQKRTTLYHMCLSVRGALMNWYDREFKGVFSRDDGTPMSVREAKAALMDELASGHEVIPCTPCDNFDWIDGCQGHPQGSETLQEALPQRQPGTASSKGKARACSIPKP
jgi:hypothetical protein